jgi:dUTPase
MKISVHRVDATLPLPEHQTEGSCAFDFIARETTVIQPHAVEFVPGNLIVKVPKSHALLILPRSSLYRKKSLLIPKNPLVYYNTIPHQHFIPLLSLPNMYLEDIS